MIADITVTAECLTALRLTDAADRVVIPATLFKGCLRAECVAIAHAIGIVHCGAPDPATRCYDPPCPLCAIFGSRWTPGLLHFTDLTADTPPALETRRTAAISRVRGQLGVVTEAQQRVAPAGSRLTGSIHADRIAIASLALVIAGCRSLGKLGGGQNVGYGWCRITAEARDRQGAPVTDAALSAALQAAQTIAAIQPGAANDAAG